MLIGELRSKFSVTREMYMTPTALDASARSESVLLGNGDLLGTERISACPAISDVRLSNTDPPVIRRVCDSEVW